MCPSTDDPDDLVTRLRELSDERRAQLIQGLAGLAFEAPSAGSPLGDPPIERVPRDGRLPLSSSETRLWFLDQYEPGTATYNLAGARRLRGPLDQVALERALGELVARHEVLRTRYVAEALEPRRVIDPAGSVPIEYLCAEEVADGEREEVARRLFETRAQTPFDLAAGPVFRATLVRFASDDHALLLMMHHIVSDGWSMGVLRRELSALYGAFARGEPSPLVELPLQYADYAAWDRAPWQDERLAGQLSYWKQHLSGAPALELPTDRPRPPIQSAKGAVCEFELDPALTAKLKVLARQEGATLFMVLLASYGVLLGRHANQKDVVVGTPIANRTPAEIEPLIGCFVNMLALRVRFDDDPTFGELLARVKRLNLDAFEHQGFPFERLVEALNPVRDMSRSPVFQAMLVLQNAPQSKLEMGSVVSEPLELEHASTQFDLTLDVTESEGGASASLEYSTVLFDRSTVERLVEHWRVLLEAICRNPATRCAELPLLAEAERHKLLVEWNDTRAEYSRDTCIHQLFEAQVERTPEAIAVVDERQRVTYGELNARANRLARVLLAHGAGRETIVGVCMARSVPMVVALLATLKAGGAYVPLDPSYPEERLAFMVEDSGAKLVLVDGRGRLPTCRAERLELDALASDDEPSHDLSRPANPDQLLAVVYTSGSTGRPKGVLATHRNFVNRFHWMWVAHPFGREERACHKTALSFVDSIWELFGPMLRGVEVHLVPEEAARDVVGFVQALARMGVTRLVLVPSLLRAMLGISDLAARLPRLRCWTVSGEALPRELASSFHERLGDRILLNLYGSSEMAADVTSEEVTPSSTAGAIGRPIYNTRVYVVDDVMQPVPIGVSGELVVGGVGLARGYHGQPEQTALKFVPDPFGEASGQRLYRTGDRARWGVDGALQYLGRVDHQVKVRGYRIELGEVEAALRAEPNVRECAVVASVGADEGQRLVAYVAPEELAVRRLRDALAQRLPEYMVPSVFVTLATLPLTPSGKVDRKALPAPDTTVAAEEYVAPRTPDEEIIAGIWCKVLRVDRIGVKDNFFEVGGHSLLAMQVVVRLQDAFDLELSVAVIFEAPTIEKLAERILEMQLSALAPETVAKMLE